MPKYKCTNEECELFGEVYSIASARITIVNGRAMDRNTQCPNCSRDREVIREAGMTTHIAGTNDQRNRMAKQW